jgi:uncharacterized protein YrrD
MADQDSPASYLTLSPGTPVVGADGDELGKVEHVLAVPEEDIFDGLVVDTPDGRRFVDAPLVAEIEADRVVLTVDASHPLPEPSANPAALGAGPDDTVPDGLSDKLRRAWDLVSGNY